MTKECAASAAKLYDDGLNDTEIGKTCGVSKTAVRSCRRRTGRASNYYGPQRGDSGEWAVYLAKDDTLLAFGTTQECAAILNMSLGAFYQLCSRARRGVGHKYNVYYSTREAVRRSLLTEDI